MTATAPATFRPAITFDSTSTGAGIPPRAERIVSGDPVQRAWNYYSSADGHFHSGLWECAVGKWRVIFTESEFCHLLAGVIVVTGDDGSERTFRAGRCIHLAGGIHRLVGCARAGPKVLCDP